MHQNGRRFAAQGGLFMSHAFRLSTLLLAVLMAAPVAQAQSRSETLVVLVEFGPNSMDIHGVGANFRTYGASGNLYDRLLTHGTKTLADGYQNPEMDRLIEAAHRETEPKKYAETVQAFTRIALTEVPKIPLMQPTQDVAMQKDVTGYQYWFHRQLDVRTLSKH